MLTTLILYAASFGINEDVAIERYNAYCSNIEWRTNTTETEVKFCEDYFNNK